MRDRRAIRSLSHRAGQADRRAFTPLHTTPAALRGDDALARSATEVAAPRRRLLAGLRDAHAETCLRVDALRRGAVALGQATGTLAGLVARLLHEAEEQHRRVELALAHLQARPGSGLVARACTDVATLAQSRGLQRDGTLLGLLGAEERRGAQEVAALRDLAHLAGQHLAARLLDLSQQERAAAARDIADLIGRRGAARQASLPAAGLRH